MIWQLNKHSQSDIITNSSDIIFQIDNNQSVENVWESLKKLIDFYNENVEEEYYYGDINIDETFEYPILVTEEMFNEYIKNGSVMINDELNHFEITEDRINKIILMNKGCMPVHKELEDLICDFFGTIGRCA